MIESFFWISIFLAFFSYIGYPLSLIIIRIFYKSKSSDFQEHTPNVTLVITVHNEEARIRTKIENTIEISYPSDRFQVIVASDCSTDYTNDIVAEYAGQGIELLDIKNRGGKENAQRYAVEHAKGEILVFTDVATRIDSMGIRQIVGNFADRTIGCVSSEDRVIDESGKGGESLYVRYEMWLRKLESSINSIVGLSGSFFAARKDVCSDFSTSMPSDFRTLLNCRKLGLRGISDPKAIGYYPSIKDESGEMDRKVRTVLRGLTTFFNHTQFLNVFRFGFFTYQYVSHKLMRWLTPYFLITAFSANVIIVLRGKGDVYTMMFIFHLALYLCAAAGMIYPKASSIIWLKVPKYFLIVNYSILVAWYKYIRGQRKVIWNPSVR